MLVLVDESLPTVLAGEIVGHDARTVRQMGWLGVSNGDLLRRAVAAGFTAFVTADRNVEHQQNIAKLGLGIIVLIARSNRIEHVQALAPRVVEVLHTLRPGQVVHVRA